MRRIPSLKSLQAFEAAARRGSFTDAGERYFQQVTEAFTTIEAATREIERHGKADILTVHSVPSFAAQWLMPRLSRFSAQHSDIDVRLNASADPVDLDAGLVDVDNATVEFHSSINFYFAFDLNRVLQRNFPCGHRIRGHTTRDG